MIYEERKPLIRRIEELRGGRALVCFFNFDRQSNPPLAGLSTQFHADVKEALFRVLKETPAPGGVDLCLYTRGGDTNSVWPLVGLLREFDPDFEVLAPFRCHSAGTLVALGAKHIVLGPLSELSPIDPSTGNQFNPIDPTDTKSRMAISVEDVQAYRDFVTADGSVPERPAQFLDRLVAQVHPLALGNVHRVHQQIKQLARSLLGLHPVEDRDTEAIIKKLTVGFHSHLHMVNRHEAREILGAEHVVFASSELIQAMDDLLRAYEETFALRRAFMLNAHVGDKLESEDRFIGGLVESRTWSYLYETKARIRQQSKLPPNVQVQLPAGQVMPLIPGLPREYQVEVMEQGWMHNTEPKGVTL